MEDISNICYFRLFFPPATCTTSKAPVTIIDRFALIDITTKKKSQKIHEKLAGYDHQAISRFKSAQLYFPSDKQRRHWHWKSNQIFFTTQTEDETGRQNELNSNNFVGAKMLRELFYIFLM